MQRFLFKPAAAATLKPLSCGVSEGIHKPLGNLDEYSSPVTLIETPVDLSSPATEMLDDLCLSDEDFEPLFEESDEEHLLDEYDMHLGIWEDISYQNYASGYDLSARPPMPHQSDQDFSSASDHTALARNNKPEPAFHDSLYSSHDHITEPTDADSPFEALDTPDISSIDDAAQTNILADLDVEEMLLDNLSNDGGAVSNGEAFFDTMEMLDHLSVDDGRGASLDQVGSELDEMLDHLSVDDGRRASLDQVGSEPDEMLDVLDLNDGMGRDWVG